MVFINEWLPNPTGNDAKGEFIELYNSDNASVNLNGWTLRATGKKVAPLDGFSIAANGYLVLHKTETKLSLKNIDEQLFLYDAKGILADHSYFSGGALDGKSLSRINYATDPSDHFAWSYPTPGAANEISLDNLISAHSYPFGAPLNSAVTPGAVQILAMSFGLGVILAVIVIYCLKSHEEISKLVFGGD